MITNIPKGMSTNNRAHPFFIILRRYAEEEENASISMSKQLLKYICLPIIPILILLTQSWARFFCIAMFVIWCFISATLYWQFRGILARLVYPQVNRMLFGDDYSASPLNYEETVNLIGIVNHNIGRINQFSDFLKMISTSQILGIFIFSMMNIIHIILSM